MENFFYRCEINLHHPMLQEALRKQRIVSSDDTPLLALVSRMFMNVEGALESLEADLPTKIMALLGDHLALEVTEVREANPCLIISDEELEAGKSDPDFDEYLAAWNDDLVYRVTCTTEDLAVDEDGDFVELPADFVVKYHVQSFDDGLTLPESAMPHLVTCTSTMQ